MAQEWKRLRSEHSRLNVDEDGIRSARKQRTADSATRHEASDTVRVSRGASARRALKSMIRLIRGDDRNPVAGRRQQRPVIQGGRWVRDLSTDE